MRTTQRGNGGHAVLGVSLMASGQITMRRVGGWQTLDQAPVKKPIDLDHGAEQMRNA